MVPSAFQELSTINKIILLGALALQQAVVHDKSKWFWNANVSVSGEAALLLCLAKNEAHEAFAVAFVLCYSDEYAKRVFGESTLDTMIRTTNNHRFLQPKTLAKTIATVAKCVVNPDQAVCEDPTDLVDAARTLVACFLADCEDTDHDKFRAAFEAEIKALSQNLSAEQGADCAGLLAGIFVAGAMKASDGIREKDDNTKRLYLAASDGFFGALGAGLAILHPALALAPAFLSSGCHVLIEKFLKVRDFRGAVTQFQGLIKAKVLGWIPSNKALTREAATRYILSMETGLNLNGLP